MLVFVHASGDGDGGEDDDDQAPSEEEEESPGTDAPTVGAEIGNALSVVRDSKCGRFDVTVQGQAMAYKEVINDQDNVSGKTKKFFELLPNSTPTLFGFLHYHALLNTTSKRGWIAHCRLRTEKPEAEGNEYILWEIWETRCVRPRIDGIVMIDDRCTRIQNLEKWLVANGLSCNLDSKFDVEFYTE